MSIKDKKRIEELERQLAYYKEMYEMRTSALIKALDGWDTARETNRKLMRYIDTMGYIELSTPTEKEVV